MGETGPDDEYTSLHAVREDLERRLSLAQAHQRFSHGAEAVARARVEETELLVELDRVMTLIRAAEVKRRPGARRW